MQIIRVKAIKNIQGVKNNLTESKCIAKHYAEQLKFNKLLPIKDIVLAGFSIH